MFCSLCQSANPDGASRCQACGGPLLAANAAFTAPLPRPVPAAPPPLHRPAAPEHKPSDVFAETPPPALPPRPTILVAREPTPPPTVAAPRPPVVIQPARPVIPPVAAVIVPVTPLAPAVPRVATLPQMPMPPAALRPVIAPAAPPPRPQTLVSTPLVLSPPPVLPVTTVTPQAVPPPPLPTTTAAPLPPIPPAAPLPTPPFSPAARLAASSAKLAEPKDEPPPPPVPAVLPTTEPQPNVVRAANWPQKLAAGMVDSAIAVALTMGYAVVEFLELPESETAESSLPLTGLDYAIDLLSRYSMLLVGMFVAVTLSAALYESLAVAIMGRTVGQKVLGVRLIRLNGKRPGVFRSLGRGLFVGVGLALMGAGWLWAPFDRRRAALHDKWTGLVLVEDPEPSTPDPGQPTPAPLATDVAAL